MADQNTEVTIALKDANDKLVAMKTAKETAETQLTDMTAKHADVALSLKETSAKLENAETELKALRDEKTARAEKDISDRVALAFDTYKDALKLTDDDKDLMLISLKHAPEKFEKKYPKVDASKQHLLRNLTEGGDKTTPKTGGGEVVTMSLRDLSRKIAAEKKIPLADAQVAARRQLADANRAPSTITIPGNAG